MKCAVALPADTSLERYSQLHFALVLQSLIASTAHSFYQSINHSSFVLEECRWHSRTCSRWFNNNRQLVTLLKIFESKLELLSKQKLLSTLMLFSLLCKDAAVRQKFYVHRDAQNIFSGWAPGIAARLWSSAFSIQTLWSSNLDGKVAHLYQRL